MKLPRTQKGKGLLALGMVPVRGSGVSDYFALPFIVVQDQEDVQRAWDRRAELFVANSCRVIHADTRKYFGRCCPSRPRHGYLESKEVDSAAALGTMLAEVLADDPGGEVLLTPMIDAAFSMVWTPDQVAIGLGHDGATSGKRLVGVYPALPVALPEWLLKMAEVKGTPFVEAVQGSLAVDRQSIATQLRDGGEGGVPTSVDYIPTTMQVKHVLVSGGELVEWEKLLANVPEGTVVDHRGGTQVDHYAWHARSHKIPVVTSFEPQVGMWLQQTVDEQVVDAKAVAEWATISCTPRLGSTHSERGELLKASLVVLHHAAAVVGKKPEIVGAALRVLMKAGLAALAGEERHHHAAKPDRMSVHNKSLLKFHETRMQMEKFQRDFCRINPWATSVGGLLWAQCTYETRRLDWVLQQLQKEQTEAWVQQALRQANVVVNLAHNGGWWLNKFLDQHFFDLCSTGHPMAWMEAAPGFQALEHLVNRPVAVTRRLLGLHERKMVQVEEPAAPCVDISPNGLAVVAWWHAKPVLYGATIGKRPVGWRELAPEELERVREEVALNGVVDTPSFLHSPGVWQVLWPGTAEHMKWLVMVSATPLPESGDVDNTLALLCTCGQWVGLGQSCTCTIQAGQHKFTCGKCGVGLDRGLRVPKLRDDAATVAQALEALGSMMDQSAIYTQPVLCPDCAAAALRELEVEVELVMQNELARRAEEAKRKLKGGRAVALCRSAKCAEPIYKKIYSHCPACGGTDVLVSPQVAMT